MRYGYSTQTSSPFAHVVKQAKEALAAEGFGVLTEIDVQATLKQKLGIEHEAYVILGACNPPYAHEALNTETEIGLLLPCNVIIYERDNKITVSAIDPVTAMSIIDNKALESIAEEIRTKLKRVVDSLTSE